MIDLKRAAHTKRCWLLAAALVFTTGAGSQGATQPPADDTPPATAPLTQPPADEAPAAAPAADPPIDEAPVAAKPAPLSIEEKAQIRTAVASRLARIGALFIRQTRDASVPAYRIASIIFEQALLLTPDDEEMLRLLIEAKHATGDEKAVLKLTRRLLTFDPEDTVAQLRLISARVRRMQTVEQRLAMYKRLLGPGSASLDASVRSRLALDAARLAREIGDDDLFVRDLTLALQLDVTNKEAAALAASYYLDRVDDPLGRVELLGNVILADPMDSSAYFDLGHEMLNNGAYSAARRFYDLGGDIVNAAGVGLDPALENDAFLLRWATDGADEFLPWLHEQELKIEHLLDKQREALAQEGKDPGLVQAWRPSLGRARVRLLAASASHHDDDARSALDRLAERMQSNIDAARSQIEQLKKESSGDISTDEAPDAAEQDRIETIRTLESTILGARSELVWLRLWTGLDLDEAAQAFAEITEQLTTQARTRYEGWLALRQGENERAIGLLKPISGDDYRALLGLSVAYEQLDRHHKAAQTLAKLVLASPGSLLGVWSRVHLEELLGAPVEPSPIAQALDAYADTLPEELEQMTADPHAFIFLSAEIAPTRTGPLDRCNLRLRLRNVSTSLPLGVGEYAPLNTSFLLVPRLSIRGIVLYKQVRPEVISLARRLRLEPGESLTVDVWAGRGQTGAALDDLAANVINLSWRVLQGFYIDQSTRQFEVGPLSLTTFSNQQLRIPPAHSDGEIGALLESLKTTRGVARLEAMLAIRSLLIQPRETFETEQELSDYRASIADSVAAIIPDLSPMERMFAVMAMPPGRAIEECKVVDDVFQISKERLSKLLMLLTRTETFDEELLLQGVDSDDAVIAEAATLLRDIRTELAGESAKDGEADGADASD